MSKILFFVILDQFLSRNGEFWLVSTIVLKAGILEDPQVLHHGLLPLGRCPCVCVCVFRAGLRVWKKKSSAPGCCPVLTVPNVTTMTPRRLRSSSAIAWGFLRSNLISTLLYLRHSAWSGDLRRWRFWNISTVDNTKTPLFFEKNRLKVTLNPIGTASGMLNIDLRNYTCTMFRIEPDHAASPRPAWRPFQGFSHIVILEYQI